MLSPRAFAAACAAALLTATALTAAAQAYPTKLELASLQRQVLEVKFGAAR